MTTKIENWNIEGIREKSKDEISIYKQVFKVEYHQWQNKFESLTFISPDSTLPASALKSMIDKANSYDLTVISTDNNKIYIIFNRNFINK